MAVLLPGRRLPAVPLVAVAVLSACAVAVWVSWAVLPLAAAKPLALRGEPLQRGADRVPVPPLSWPVAAGLAAQDSAGRSCRAVLGGVVAVARPAMPTRPVRRGASRPAGRWTRRGTGRTGRCCILVPAERLPRTWQEFLSRPWRCSAASPAHPCVRSSVGGAGRLVGIAAGRFPVGRRVLGPRPVPVGIAGGCGVGV